MFKACLFLCAGAIIHAMAHLKHRTLIDFDAQDIRLMGGLRKRMPFTFVAFLLASLASAGVPLSAGFLSKDEILASVCSWSAVQSNPIHLLLPVLIFSTSLMTAFYTGRMFFLVFFGGFRLGKVFPALKEYGSYVHEAPKPMLFSYLALAPFCLFVFFSFNPVDPDVSWLTTYLSHPASVFSSESLFLEQLHVKRNELHYWVISFSVVVLSLGFGLSYVLYGFKTKFKKDFLRLHLHNSGLVNLSYSALYLNQVYDKVLVKPYNRLSNFSASFDKEWVDGSIDKFAILFMAFSHFWAWFDKWVVDGSVTALMWLIEAIGRQLKTLQNGKVQSYLSYAFIAIVFVIAFVIYK